MNNNDKKGAEKLLFLCQYTRDVIVRGALVLAEDKFSTRSLFDFEINVTRSSDRRIIENA